MPVGVAGILEAGETQGSVRDRECGWAVYTEGVSINR